MKLIFLILMLVSFLYSKSENISLLNNIKRVIQKEEYIALSINKYILQTGEIPKTTASIIDWTVLLTSDYLGENFNRTNPLTSEDMNVYFDTDNNAFISGVFDNDAEIDDSNTSYNSKLGFAYNLYINRVYRVNTLVPKSNSLEDLEKGSSIIYSVIQKDIVSKINNSSTILLDSKKCNSGTYYYELSNRDLTYKYCKDSEGITVYQEEPIYVENIDDLNFIKTKIGSTAYAKKNGTWFEYYYQGDLSTRWIPKGTGSSVGIIDDESNIEDQILLYIPSAKDLVFRRDGGCMLANGDIFCWGNNDYKKAGIESYGQLDTSLSPDYINTPVMLKVQINDTLRNTKKWYNNPYRVKFEKMSMNSTNVCAVSPIFKYTSDGIEKKVGGDLYCNGQITATYFEDLEANQTKTSILKKNKFFNIGKSDLLEDGNEIYLKDIVMVEDAGVVLSDAGEIYSFGKNYDGVLGINKTDTFFVSNNPTKIDTTGVIFKKIFALRDIRGLGALDENNDFWIWGKRPNKKVYYKPTKLATTERFNKDAIFVNTNEFVLKSVYNRFYKTTGDRSIEEVRDDSNNRIPSSAISVSVFGDYYLYINENLELKGSNRLLQCMKKDESAICSNSVNRNIFSDALLKLNTKSNSINNKDYANFANTSIFKLDHVITETYEDFESTAEGWSNNNRTIVSDDGTNQLASTNFLGRFPTAVSQAEDYYEVSKTYTFSTYPNYEVEIVFDFYEIDTWDGERFEVYVNDELLAVDHFIFDGHPLGDTNITGVNLQDNINTNTGYAGDQAYRYKLKAKLNPQGEVTLKFKTRFEYDAPYVNHYSKTYDQGSYQEDVENESWGIDNVRVKVKETNKKFVCSMTGLGSASQLYCWGNIARSIPILSTSLYDTDKISIINKLFITQEEDKKDQMTYDQYHSSGKLHLKFPTYIGGFDYEFYFK